MGLDARAPVVIISFSTAVLVKGAIANAKLVLMQLIVHRVKLGQPLLFSKMEFVWLLNHHLIL